MRPLHTLPPLLLALGTGFPWIRSSIQRPRSSLFWAIAPSGPQNKRLPPAFFETPRLFGDCTKCMLPPLFLPCLAPIFNFTNPFFLAFYSFRFFPTPCLWVIPPHPPSMSRLPVATVLSNWSAFVTLFPAFDPLPLKARCPLSLFPIKYPNRVLFCIFLGLMTGQGSYFGPLFDAVPLSFLPHILMFDSLLFLLLFCAHFPSLGLFAKGAFAFF